mmetsp:Transcript_3101/g.3526  ORF Transcript_3101/g.3526 Transcript_3101/m.3526 type:complete len:141 (+) Transcript_3101:25-447(+)
MTGGYLATCGKPNIKCFVAVDTSVSPKTVIGVIMTEIPSDPENEPKVQELIRKELPPARRNDVLGYIEKVEVVVEWWRKGIATALISKKISFIRQTMPKVVAMYLDVRVANKGAIALYEKAGFKVLTKDGVWMSMVLYLL